jgi:general secretion pathway protein K
MTIMAAITVALMEDIQIAVKRTINVQAYAQADWQADGAEDFVRAYLTTDFAALPEAGKAALLGAREPLVLPTLEGTITVTLKDASQCFNLNALINSEGQEDTDAVQEFARIAELLGLPQNQAISLANALVDWQDADQQQSPNGAEDGTYLRKNPPYRTADTALRGPEELRAIHGMDEDLWELFKPFVCTGRTGERPPVNVNSLPVERLLILAAALGGTENAADAVPAASALLQQRPQTGYTSQEQLDNIVMGTEVEGLNTARIGIEVTSVFVEVVTELGPAERVRSYRFDGLGLDDTPQLTYRGWGRETFRPEIETQIDGESETEVDAR